MRRLKAPLPLSLVASIVLFSLTKKHADQILPVGVQFKKRTQLKSELGSFPWNFLRICSFALQSHKLWGMTITLETMLRHMGWANQQIISQIAQLPDEALDAYVTHKEWNVAEILFHTIVSADRLVFRITGRDVTEMTKPKNMNELKDLARKLEKFDAELIELVNTPDKVVEVNRNGVISHWQAATILSQAVHHVIEHKCQAVTALEFRGFKAPDLDESDVWGYERSTK